jgi:hypothetical protein
MSSKSQAPDSSFSSKTSSFFKKDTSTFKLNKFVGGISLISTGRKPSATGTISSTGNRSSGVEATMGGDSFKEAHEYGLETTGPVATGYDDMGIDTVGPPEKYTRRTQTPENVDNTDPTSLIFPPQSKQEDETSLID